MQGAGPIGVVCCPTRELAQQIYVEARKFAVPLGLRVVALIGGLSKYQQSLQLRGGSDIVIATPVCVVGRRLRAEGTRSGIALLSALGAGLALLAQLAVFPLCCGPPLSAPWVPFSAYFPVRGGTTSDPRHHKEEGIIPHCAQLVSLPPLFCLPPVPLSTGTLHRHAET